MDRTLTWLLARVKIVLPLTDNQQRVAPIQLPLPTEDADELTPIVTIFSIGVLLMIPVLWAFDLLSGRTVFVVTFIWYLICSEVFAPSQPGRMWWRWQRNIKLGGWTILAFIIYERVAPVFG